LNQEEAEDVTDLVGSEGHFHWKGERVSWQQKRSPEVSSSPPSWSPSSREQVEEDSDEELFVRRRGDEESFSG